jgi:hypothetical protein
MEAHTYSIAALIELYYTRQCNNGLMKMKTKYLHVVTLHGGDAVPHRKCNHRKQLRAMVAHACNPSYLGGRVVEITVEGQSEEIVHKNPSPK